jgi:hypothetical protein
MSDTEIRNQAHDLVSGKIKRVEPVITHYVVVELIALQGEILGDGVKWYYERAVESVTRIVNSVIDKYVRPDESEDRQPLLAIPGYDHLQTAYSVKRDGQRMIVPLQLLRKKELLGRADEFDRQSSGLAKHAEEIRRYVEECEASDPQRWADEEIEAQLQEETGWHDSAA